MQVEKAPVEFDGHRGSGEPLADGTGYLVAGGSVGKLVLGLVGISELYGQDDGTDWRGWSVETMDTWTTLFLERTWLGRGPKQNNKP